MLNSNKIFATAAGIFFAVMLLVTVGREGKDLKVGLFGVVQVLHQNSPYDNPTDINRPLFRYAPPFALLQRPFLIYSEMTAPFQFTGITNSIIAWYLAEVMALLVSVIVLLKLIPAVSLKAKARNLKLSLILASPLIAYELANGQNKLIALAFMLLSVYFFEKERNFISSIFFSLASVVYIPLVFFVIYFAMKKGVRYFLTFIPAALLVFIVAPSLFWSFDFNNFLLKDWYLRCLKPFFLSSSYSSYIELRTSSQSLASAVARLFVTGKTGAYHYAVSPGTLHGLVRMFSFGILLLSFLAARKRSSIIGLHYIIFFSLALILPSYCITYTWAWLFVFYFIILNNIENPWMPDWQKKLLTGMMTALVLGSYSAAFKAFNYISVLCWATVFSWAGAAAMTMTERECEIAKRRYFCCINCS